MHSANTTDFDNYEPQGEPPAPTAIILAVTDEKRRERWTRVLCTAGHVVRHVQDAPALNRAVSEQQPGAVILDETFEEKAEIETARRLLDRNADLSVILVTEQEAFDFAVEVMKIGVTDLIDPAAENARLLEAASVALDRTRDLHDRHLRIKRLRDMCRKLNAAQAESHRQVEVLCQDLAVAYEDIADQLSETAMASEFKTLLAQELDVEDLLRTTLEYMLAKIGPTNAAVFLPDEHRHYTLGAYVNYSCPREASELLMDQLSHSLCHEMESEREILFFDHAHDFACHFDADAAFLDDSQVIVFSCVDGGECLATMVLFRENDEPFELNVISLIDTLRTIFARQVSSVINVHHRASPSWPTETVDDVFDVDDEYGFGGLAA